MSSLKFLPRLSNVENAHSFPTIQKNSQNKQSTKKPQRKLEIFLQRKHKYAMLNSQHSCYIIQVGELEVKVAVLQFRQKSKVFGGAWKDQKIAKHIEASRFPW